jgi:hypothetical protein
MREGWREGGKGGKEGRKGMRGGGVYNEGERRCAK